MVLLGCAATTQRQQVVSEEVKDWAKDTVVQEKTILTRAPNPKAVTVLYFRNVSKDPTFDPLQKGFTDMLINDLLKVKSIKVVERTRMQALLEELELGKTGLVDDASAPRIGRLMGAAHLVNGRFNLTPQEDLSLNSGIVRTEISKVIATQEEQGPVSDFFSVEKALALKIIDDLQIVLSDDERKALLAHMTRSFPAFKAYSLGLDLSDQNRIAEAIQAYKEAISIDPRFKQARLALNQLLLISGRVRSDRAILLDQVSQGTSHTNDVIPDATMRRTRTGASVVTSDVPVGIIIEPGAQ